MNSDPSKVAVRSTRVVDSGQKTQPGADRRGQRHRPSRPLNQLHNPAPHLDAMLADQRVNKLPHIQRITTSLRHQTPKPRTRRNRHQPMHQRDNLILLQRTQSQRHRIGFGQTPPQPIHLHTLRHRPDSGHQQQRKLGHLPTQPTPHRQTRVIGPLQIVHSQNHRTRRTKPIDQDQQQLRRRRDRITRRNHAGGVPAHNRSEISARAGSDAPGPTPNASNNTRSGNGSLVSSARATNNWQPASST